MLKHLSQFGTLVKCQLKKLKMDSTHFTTMPNFRGPTVVSATRSIEDIHNNIIRTHSRSNALGSNSNPRWSDSQQLRANTSISLKQSIIDEGGDITGHTGTQQSRDIRGVKYPGIDDYL